MRVPNLDRHLTYFNLLVAVWYVKCYRPAKKDELNSRGMHFQDADYDVPSENVPLGKVCRTQVHKQAIIFDNPVYDTM